MFVCVRVRVRACVRAFAALEFIYGIPLYACDQVGACV